MDEETKVQKFRLLFHLLMSFWLTLMFPGLGLLQMTNHFPVGLRPPSCQGSECLASFVLFLFQRVSMILWSLLSRTGWLTHCQAHLSLSTAEHVLMSLFCPGKTFFSSPSTQISTIKAQMTTPPCYPPWLQLQKNNFCFPLMPIESQLNDSLLHLLVNLLIGQRRLCSTRHCI